jgi:hypothetical protein
MKQRYVKMSPALSLWEIIDHFAVQGHVQTFGYVVLVPESEYKRLLCASKDKPWLEKRIRNLTKKENMQDGRKKNVFPENN